MTNVFLVRSLVFVLRRLVFGEVLAGTKIVGGGEGEEGAVPEGTLSPPE